MRESAYSIDKSLSLLNRDKRRVPLTVQLNEQIDKIRYSIGTGKLFENEVYQIIEAELPEFIKGGRTAEQTAKIIDNCVSVYLNE